MYQTFVAFAAIAIAARGVSAAGCAPYNSNQLVQKCGSQYFDLRNIKGADGKTILSAEDKGRGYDYLVQFDKGLPKTLTNCSLSDSNTFGVQVRRDGGGCYRLGSVDLLAFDYDNSTKQFTVTATGGDNGRSMSIKTQCTFGANYASLTETGETGLTYNFNLNLPSKRCTSSPPSGGGGGGSSSSTDGGAIALAIFFGVLGGYFLFGAIFLAAVKGRRGADMVPNLEFWTTLPGLVKDGTYFCVSKVRGTASRGNYSEI